MRIAIVGAGIAGLGSAWLLQRQGHAVTLFEAKATSAGIRPPSTSRSRACAFRSTPDFWSTTTARTRGSSRCSTSWASRASQARCRFRAASIARGLEWSGTSVASLFAQPRNALRPAFWRMLADIAALQSRHDRARSPATTVWSVSLGEYLEARSVSARRSATGTCCRWLRRHLVVAAPRHPRFSAADVRALLPQSRPAADRSTGRGGAPCRAARAPMSTKIAAALAGRARRAHPVRRVVRRADHVADRYARQHGASASTRSCSPAIATRRARCSPTARRRRSACWRACAIRRIASCCTPTRRCCRARGARGRRGTTSPSTIPTARGRSPSRTSSTSCSRCRAARRSSSRSTRRSSPRRGSYCGEFEYAHPLLDGHGARARNRRSRSCRASATRGSRAHGWATASTRTDSPRRMPSPTPSRGSVRRTARRRARRRMIRRTAAMTARLPDSATMNSRRALAADAPCLIAGDVMHRRTRPAANAFAYPAFCLRLPLSRLADARADAAYGWNRPGLVSFHDRDHGARDGTLARARGCAAARRAKACRPTARSCCTRSRACWATCSTRSASGCATTPRLRARRARRSQQHVRRDASLPVRARRRTRARQRARR